MSKYILCIIEDLKHIIRTGRRSGSSSRRRKRRKRRRKKRRRRKRKAKESFREYK